MSDSNGWIKLHRKLLDNPIIMKDADHLAVWMYLLLNATHAEYPALFRGKKITLKAGQLITGRKSIAEKLCVNESKVRRVLDAFESDQQIDRQRSNQNTLISLVNWDKYQICDQQIDQQMTNERPTSDQRVTTNKNVKNIKNVKNERKEHSANQPSKAEIDSFFDTIWNLYPVKKGKGQVSDAKRKALFAIGYEEMHRAIERYLQELKKDSSWRKPQNGSTFFNSGYVDYLDQNFVPDETKVNTGTPDGQRQDDLDDLF